MRLRFFVLPICACAFLVGCGSSDSRTVLLRLKPAVGDTYSLEYKTTSKYDGPGAGEGQGLVHENSVIISDKTLKCTKVEGEKATWETLTTDAKTSGVGMMAAQAADSALHEKGKKDHFVRSDRNVFLSEILMSPLEPEFPIQAVQVGDSWHGEAYLQGRKLVMTYSLKGFEKLDGKDAIVITGTSETTQSVDQVKPIMIWYEPNTGLPFKGVCEYLIELSPGAKLDLTYEVTRK